tara:strand:+ start:1386 stop:1595 length:210 start_codon:yes stop_codon:yes gene_type:complete
MSMFQMFTENNGIELGEPHEDGRQLIVEAMRLTRSTQGGGEMAGESIVVKRIADSQIVATIRNGLVKTS